MGKYKVIEPLRNKGKMYKPGAVVELSDDIAKHIPNIVVPIPNSMEVIESDEMPVQEEVTEKANQTKKSKGK